MVEDDRGKKFSCLKCGASFIGYPPDDFHQIASLDPKEIGDPKKIEYRCKECGSTNVLYWGWQNLSFSM
jgi:DNA-directed RNA polymerase subunit RPC12/RpoP